MAPTSQKRARNAFLLFTIALFLLNVVHAMSWVAPAPTRMGLMPLRGISPRPTPAPILRRDRRNILARQDNTDSSTCVPVGANTCAYFVDHGTLDGGISCAEGATCVFQDTVLDCCRNLGSCTPAAPTACVNSAAGCDKACVADSRALYCSDADRPHCATYYLDSGGVVYDCSGDGWAYSIALPWDYNTTLCYTEPISFAAAVIITSTTASTTSTGSTSASSTTSPFLPALVATTVSPTPSSPAQKQPTPVGAIAGASIGGFAVLAIAAAGLLYFCFIVRRRHREGERGDKGYDPHTSGTSYPGPGGYGGGKGGWVGYEPTEVPGTYVPPRPYSVPPVGQPVVVAGVGGAGGPYLTPSSPSPYLGPGGGEAAERGRRASSGAVAPGAGTGAVAAVSSSPRVGVIPRTEVGRMRSQELQGGDIGGRGKAGLAGAAGEEERGAESGGEIIRIGVERGSV